MTTSKYNCVDCGQFSDSFMLRHDLWDKITFGNKRMFLCFACTERRLGHEIHEEHLIPHLITNRLLIRLMRRCP